MPFFRDDVDRTDFCNRLARVVARAGIRCEAFCLMSTHYHLVLDVPGDDLLQSSIHWLNGTYAQQFNRRHGRWGHLCGSRYGLTSIESRGQLLRTVRYVVRNPVAADMCERPEDYAWSSYRGTLGLGAPFPFVADGEIVAFFGGVRDAAVERLRTYVDAVGEDVTLS